MARIGLVSGPSSGDSVLWNDVCVDCLFPVEDEKKRWWLSEVTDDEMQSCRRFMGAENVEMM